MGVFKKLKDVLFDVEEEEIPVISEEPKKEEKKDSITETLKIITEDKSPIKEIKVPKEEEIPERELLKSESTFNFPVDIEEDRPSRVKRDYDFDDDFNKEEFRKPVKQEPKRKYPDYSELLKDEEKKAPSSVPFKPSPVISPVYGILDQNYTKDDVIVKTDIGVKGPDLDSVRRKAYGLPQKKEEKIKEVEDEFTEPLKTLDEILIDNEPQEEIQEEIKEEPIEEMPIKRKQKVELEFTEEIEVLPKKKAEPEEEKEEINEEDNDKTLETDLFNLIDSMYEDKEESEEE